MNLKYLMKKWKTKLSVMLLLITVLAASCSDDDAPKTLPQVTTATATNVETNAATLNGAIENDGNAKVTASGFVYSSVVAIPTMADSKVELTDTEDDFTTVVNGLASGTIYHVRAYATNSVGTGYGEVVNFTTGNAAPVVTNVAISGDLEVNKELTVTYTYSDAEGDAQGATTIQWYMANDASGAGETAIAGATESTYTVGEALQNKYIRVGVTPKAVTGTTTGSQVKSIALGAVGEATSVTFMYNGQEVTYGIITSVTTGKKWLDRNLGAMQVASATNDYTNYGDLFQWGRSADGHQMVTRSGPNDADIIGVNGTTISISPWEQSANDSPGHAKFIIVPNEGAGGGSFDWRKPQNNNLWQGTDPINNPCPIGWRIPTKAEWAGENLVSIASAYTKLKIPLTGYRDANNASFSSSVAGSYYWTSTIGPDLSGDLTYSIFVSFGVDSYSESPIFRGIGLACRCTKN